MRVTVQAGRVGTDTLSWIRIDSPWRHQNGSSSFARELGRRHRSCLVPANDCVPGKEPGSKRKQSVFPSFAFAHSFGSIPPQKTPFLGRIGFASCNKDRSPSCLSSALTFITCAAHSFEAAPCRRGVATGAEVPPELEVRGESCPAQLLLRCCCFRFCVEFLSLISLRTRPGPSAGGGVRGGRRGIGPADDPHLVRHRSRELHLGP